VSGPRVINRVRRAFYLDSVALMRLSRELSGRPGVEEAALMVGTPSNKEILDEAGLLADDGRQAAGGDVIIALRAANLEAGEAALAEAETLLGRSAARGEVAGRWRPRSLAAAAQALPGAGLALISVPGAFATAEARKALRRGLHVLLFSDNVPLAEEYALKQEAHRRGLLLMGPDCGTSLISGTPLAFANRVRRGSVGIISASGTGLQEVSSLIDRGGGGVSHGIGVGSRDLSATVGGAMTLMVIDALEEDPETEHVVLLSKPPAPSAARQVLERLAQSRKRYTVCFVGLEEEAEVPANACWAPTLTAAAERALGTAILLPERLRGAAGEAAAALAAGRRRVWGLFCGGTLCAEAQAVLRRAGELVGSNVPVPGALALDANRSAHRLIDLGADEYTRGRPHPMIEPSARNDALGQSLAEADTAAVLIDVVIGVGAHADPAGAVAKVVADARGARPIVVASVCGTEADPQVHSAQVSKLEAAGVLVAPSNARAAEIAVAISRRQA
jgi:succinyl-CoA synthetase alpha subunit